MKKDKILLIEDNLEVRENTAELLELSNFDVTTAENGKVGIQKAKEELPDLIICDIMMPELDGYGVLQFLSRDPQTAGIPFVFLTAKADKTDLRKGMNLGADDYLTKPFEETELIDTIEMRLKKHRRLTQDFEKSKGGIEDFFEEAKSHGRLEDLLVDKKTRSFKKKESIYREGDYANYLYFLESGKVKGYKTDDYGKEFVTELYAKGDFIGYFDLLKGDEYSDSAAALEDSQLLIVPRRDFEDLVFKNRDVASQFIKLLANNIGEREEELLRLAFSPVRERAAAALLKLHKKYSNEDNPKISISREDLAGMVGTATESIIRTLSDFKEEGLIEIKSRDIYLREIEKLKALAQV
ncbi:MAG: response regulator [Flavobacteriales bacterium]|nr:response regulator [Flavobacteriales bacterium]